IFEISFCFLCLSHASVSRSLWRLFYFLGVEKPLYPEKSSRQAVPFTFRIFEISFCFLCVEAYFEIRE
ncbi:hypothetical protein, partial [Candidatus Avelusimicrobium alvi]|uniref:hypothetical protein n=1 Tax=Candidatus Avelusimicrobium alvi TaxID=3416221 RepID=UPI003D14E988